MIGEQLLSFLDPPFAYMHTERDTHRGRNRVIKASSLLLKQETKTFFWEETGSTGVEDIGVEYLGVLLQKSMKQIKSVILLSLL